ncbi:MAG: aminopeptidase [Candidatus Pacebacteria bacterium]|jgi:aspartyl aminopeptidase|nr:aminopeptidase [Candidatus Paceibacterota bacterium]
MDDKKENGELNLTFERKYAFDIWDEAVTKGAFDFCEGYKEFLNRARSERQAVKFIVEAAKNVGFKELEHVGNVKDKGFSFPVYSVNRGKAVVLARPGRQPVSDGMRIMMAHLDTPHLDLKVRPLYENEHVAFLKTQYYGGIKKYQWTNLPLAMSGIVARQDGTTIEVEVGADPKDPVLMITDIAPHLDKIQSKEKIDDAIPAETLNIVLGSIGAKAKDGDKEKEKDAVKKQVLQLLNGKYGIAEEDFVSADIELLPAGGARDLGLDRSMVAAPGQDDRSCAYDILRAFLDAGQPEYCTIAVFMDKEEIGSQGATSSQSNFFIDFASELLYLETGAHDENVLRDAFSKTKAVSADTTFAFDPDYPEVFDSLNTARLGAGVAIEKYTGGGGKYSSSEATAEFVAYIRNVLNANGIVWQTGGGGKIDIGGGATISMYFSRLNMDIVDLSIPVLSVHAPFEISSKADIYSAYLAYKAFFESK